MIYLYYFSLLFSKILTMKHLSLCLLEVIIISGDYPVGRYYFSLISVHTKDDLCFLPYNSRICQSYCNIY